MLEHRVRGAEVQVHVFAAQDPVLRQRVFNAGAKRNANVKAAVRSDRTGRAGIAVRTTELCQRRVNVSPGRASRDIDQRAIRGEPEARAQCAELVEPG